MIALGRRRRRHRHRHCLRVPINSGMCSVDSARGNQFLNDFSNAEAPGKTNDPKPIKINLHFGARGMDDVPGWMRCGIDEGLIHVVGGFGLDLDWTTKCHLFKCYLLKQHSCYTEFEHPLLLVRPLIWKINKNTYSNTFPTLISCIPIKRRIRGNKTTSPIECWRCQ